MHKFSAYANMQVNSFIENYAQHAQHNFLYSYYCLNENYAQHAQHIKTFLLLLK